MVDGNLWMLSEDSKLSNLLYEQRLMEWRIKYWDPVKVEAFKQNYLNNPIYAQISVGERARLEKILSLSRVRSNEGKVESAPLFSSELIAQIKSDIEEIKRDKCSLIICDIMENLEYLKSMLPPVNLEDCPNTECNVIDVRALLEIYSSRYDNAVTNVSADLKEKLVLELDKKINILFSHERWGASKKTKLEKAVAIVSEIRKETFRIVFWPFKKGIDYAADVVGLGGAKNKMDNLRGELTDGIDKMKIGDCSFLDCSLDRLKPLMKAGTNVIFFDPEGMLNSLFDGAENFFSHNACRERRKAAGKDVDNEESLACFSDLREDVIEFIFRPIRNSSDYMTDLLGIDNIVAEFDKIRTKLTDFIASANVDKLSYIGFILESLKPFAESGINAGMLNFEIALNKLIEGVEQISYKTVEDVIVNFAIPMTAGKIKAFEYMKQDLENVKNMLNEREARLEKLKSKNEISEEKYNEEKKKIKVRKELLAEKTYIRGTFLIVFIPNYKEFLGAYYGYNSEEDLLNCQQYAKLCKCDKASYTHDIESCETHPLYSSGGLKHFRWLLNVNTFSGHKESGLLGSTIKFVGTGAFLIFCAGEELFMKEEKIDY